MSISVTSGTRTSVAKVLSQYRIEEKTDERLVLQTKRTVALVAAALLGLFGGAVAAATSHFYPPMHQDDKWTLLLGGGIGVLALALAVLFLYFGLRKQDRIILDAQQKEIRFARRRVPAVVPFELIEEVVVRTENRSRRRERCIVHPVVLVIRDGRELEIDAASDIEEMIRLAADVRRVTGVALPEE